MKKLSKIYIVIGIFLSCILAGCTDGSVNITLDYIELSVGDTYQIEYTTILEDTKATFESSDECVSVSDDGTLTAISCGESTITIYIGFYTDKVIVTVKDDTTDENPDINPDITPDIEDEKSITLEASSEIINEGEYLTLSFDANFNYDEYEYEYIFEEGQDLVDIDGNNLLAKYHGVVSLYLLIDNVKSNVVKIVIEELILTDPYVGMSKYDFYKDYKKASSKLDAEYRTKHYFMSGDITPQDQYATIETNQPSLNDNLIKNSKTIFSDDGCTYYVVDAKGEIVNQVYKDAGYASLEDVAAYIYAFCDIPANYDENKKASPKSSDWGEYLRVNNNYFSGDTSGYPYEPELPNISGIGGDLQYYEVDLGTTGNDCDPTYPSRVYNNGSSITRGASRIVYSKYYTSGKDITDYSDRYLFYTNNHYNDFREYLNYQNGWGEIFGNITGGGTISSKVDYNPTFYPNVSLKDLVANVNNILENNLKSYVN